MTQPRSGGRFRAVGGVPSIVIAAAVTFSVIVLAILLFGIHLAFDESPLYDDTVVTTDVRDSVFVYRNEFAIPHIIAVKDEDAFVALGYIHARDRLWQMDFLRRVARGRLAEIFGEQFVATDAFFRTLGIEHTTRSVIYPGLSAESKRVLSAYARGVNLFLSNHRNQLPFEFGALGYTPDPWEATDCIAIGRLIAFDLSMSFWVDIVLGEIADRYGVETALALIPEDQPYSPRVLQPNQLPTPAQRQQPESHSSWWNAPGVDRLLDRFATVYSTARIQAGMQGYSSGSNSWAVSLSGPDGNDAILANDPHLALGLPPRWYQVHLSSPNYNVIGVTVPGLPVVLSGRNNTIAWGATNVMLDDCDYFIEVRDSLRPSLVIVGSEKLKVRVRFDTIKARRKGLPMSEHRIRIETVLGRPILSSVHPSARNDSIIGFPLTHSGTSLAERYALSVAWTGLQPSDEVAAILGVMRARSWTQFRHALRTWAVPALNFTYADIAGNIGIQPAGSVPQRDSGHPNLPRPGWNRRYHWRGIMTNAFPSVYNPPSKYVASANNKTSDSLSFFVSYLWEPSSRAERIAELRSLSGDYTVRDAQLEQLDVYSSYALRIQRRTVPILERAPLDSIELSALQIFARWNCYLHPRSSAAAIYSVFLERLSNIVFRLRIGESEYQRYSFVPSVPLRRLDDILHRPTCWVSSDSATAERLLYRAVVQAWKEAITHLRTQYSPQMSQWQWGKIHTLELEHPLAKVPAYRSLLQRRLTTIGGDATTLANGLWRLHRPFSMHIGASMRQVLRLRDTVVYTIVPGGVSGNPLSVHFADQLTLWSNGGLLPIPLTPKPTENWELSVRFIPIRQSR
ncbi:MAG: penicillin acylase family protein [Chlorobi bacterium]|nr:penicillin acylase family protein [Chlorobiota bacterium]